MGDYLPVFCLPFDFRFYLLDSIENVFSRTCVLPKIECIGKILQFGKSVFADKFPEALYSLQEWPIKLAGRQLSEGRV